MNTLTKNNISIAELIANIHARDIYVTPELHLGYGNTPRFKFESSIYLDETDDLLIAPHYFVGDKIIDGGITYEAILGGMFAKYQSVCTDRSGNPHYGIRVNVPDRKEVYCFPSGWSARPGVVNQKFGTSLIGTVTMGGIAIDVRQALMVLAESSYSGWVMIGSSLDDTDLDFTIAPWDIQKAGCYGEEEEDCVLLHTDDEDFYQDAIDILQHHLDYEGEGEYSCVAAYSYANSIVKPHSEVTLDVFDKVSAKDSCVEDDAGFDDIPF